MKKTLNLLLLLLSLFSYSQSGPNPFEEPKSENTFSKENSTKENQLKDAHPQSLDTGGGNPGDPVPVDNYIPLLIITGIGIIIYTTQKKKKLQS